MGKILELSGVREQEGANANAFFKCLMITFLAEAIHHVFGKCRRDEKGKSLLNVIRATACFVQVMVKVKDGLLMRVLVSTSCSNIIDLTTGQRTRSTKTEINSRIPCNFPIYGAFWNGRLL